MITELKKVKTIEELMDYINAFSLPTDTDSTCFMQDIVGHTEIGKLEEIATKMPDKLYFILYNIWSWSEFVSFWNRVSNTDMKLLHGAYDKLKYDHDDLKAAYDASQNQYNNEHETTMNLVKRLQNANTEIENYKTKISDYENEIIRLKAQLFDMISKNSKIFDNIA